MALRDLYDTDCTREVDDVHLVAMGNTLNTSLVSLDSSYAEFLQLTITDSRDGVVNAILLDKISAGIVLEALVGYLSNA